jgi:hypothetical protein
MNALQSSSVNRCQLCPSEEFLTDQLPLLLVVVGPGWHLEATRRAAALDEEPLEDALPVKGVGARHRP